MVVSKSKKFVFVHIYKNAGTSISSELYKYATFRQKICYYYFTTYLFKFLNKIIPTKYSVQSLFTGLKMHSTVLDIKNSGLEIENYFKFCVVRNPYVWLISQYNYVKKSKNHRNYKLFKNLTFSEFIDFEIKKNNNRQIDFCVDNDGNFVIDFFCKFENIENDMNIVRKKIGLPQKKLEHKNKNKIKSDDLVKDFFSEDLLKKVNDYYSLDFENFLYNKLYHL